MYHWGHRPTMVCVCLYELYVHVTVHRNKFLLINQPEGIIIQIYSVIKFYMFRASSLPIIRNFSTVHSALVSFMQVLMTASKQSQDGNPLEFHPDSA